MSTLRALPAILLLLPLASFAGASTHMIEDWESGDDGWTLAGTGVGLICGDAAQGCSLRLAPDCCDAWTTATRNVSVPLTGRLALDFAFRPDVEWGGTDSDVVVAFDEGSIVFETTNWYNNGLGLVTDHGIDQAFTYWWGEGSWIRLRLLIDGETHRAQAQQLDEEGRVLAGSRVLPFSANATSITSIAARAITWNMPVAFQYDDLALAPSDACFVPRASIGATEWYHYHGDVVVFDVSLEDAADCATLTSWSVEFGDGAVVGGGLPAPSTVEHVFESPGTYDVALVAALDDGSTLRSLTRVHIDDACDDRSYVYADAPWSGPTGEPIAIELVTDIHESCAPIASWTLDTGDGAPLRSGQGAPPAAIGHTYTAPGRHEITFDVTLEDGATFLSQTSFFAYELRTQTVTGSSTLEAWPLEIDEESLVELESPGMFRSRLTLTYTSPFPVADLDAVFFDENGRMPQQPCSRLLSDEACDVPEGATHVRIEGDAALVDWTLVYAYPIYA